MREIFGYHYTSIHNALAYILKDMKIQMGQFKDTNDPLEFSYWNTGYSISGNEVDSHDVYEMNNSNNVLLNVRRSNSFFLSLCLDGEVSAGDMKQRMWAQYGENHMGVCIKFNLVKLNRVFEDLFHTNFLSDKVSYFNAENLPRKLQEFTEQNSTTGFRKLTHLDIPWFIKPDDFKDENEYRFVVFDTVSKDLLNTNGKPTLDIVECLAGITIYVDNTRKRMRNPMLKYIEFICEEKSIPIDRIHFFNGRYIRITPNVHLENV